MNGKQIFASQEFLAGSIAGTEYHLAGEIGIARVGDDWVWFAKGSLDPEEIEAENASGKDIVLTHGGAISYIAIPLDVMSRLRHAIEWIDEKYKTVLEKQIAAQH